MGRRAEIPILAALAPRGKRREVKENAQNPKEFYFYD